MPHWADWKRSLRVKPFFCLNFLLCFCAPAPSAAAQPDAAAPQKNDAQTIVLFRHGEKPENGLGQLTCRGLNRALALPDVLKTQFGAPDALFAPNPGARKKDHGVYYSYVRPLATIEPTAIRFGLPVDARFSYAQIAKLRAELMRKKYRSSTIFISWEHHAIPRIARALIAARGGDPAQVVDWPREDFDGLYVVKIFWNAQRAPYVIFEHRQQGLGNLAHACPQPLLDK